MSYGVKFKNILNLIIKVIKISLNRKNWSRRRNKNQIKFYDQVELNNNLKLISDKFDVDIKKLKKMYFVANKENTLNKELFNDLVLTLKNETK